VAYNRVSDLSQLSMLENLQLLDLEESDVNDLVQVQYLGQRSQLCTLTLEGNPVCMHPHPNATQVFPHTPTLLTLTTTTIICIIVYITESGF
jgi:hypothetical protein